MSMDPDKDMLALPAKAELSGPKMPPAPKMRVNAPEHDAGPTERLVGHVVRCSHRDGIYVRISENEL